MLDSLLPSPIAIAYAIAFAQVHEENKIQFVHSVPPFGLISLGLTQRLGLVTSPSFDLDLGSGFRFGFLAQLAFVGLEKFDDQLAIGQELHPLALVQSDGEAS